MFKNLLKKNPRLNGFILTIQKDFNENTKIWILSLILIGGVITFVLLYAVVLLIFTWPITEFSVAKSGVFGDSFGALTSLFSGLAFAGLIITIVMQKDELALQREELSLTRQELTGQKEEMRVQNETMKIQRFENTFFKQLEFLAVCRNDITTLTNDNEKVTGRSAIKTIYERFITNYLYEDSNEFDSWGRTKRIFANKCKDLIGIKVKYNNFYSNQNGTELGQYFRTIYNILKLINNNSLNVDKKIYTNLLRAQLSRYELTLLFYNCLSTFGEEKMMPLVKRYKILKHLEDSTLPSENIDIWQQFKIQQATV
jgi:hypothetical protein